MRGRFSGGPAFGVLKRMGRTRSHAQKKGEDGEFDEESALGGALAGGMLAGRVPCDAVHCVGLGERAGAGCGRFIGRWRGVERRI